VTHDRPVNKLTLYLKYLAPSFDRSIVAYFSGHHLYVKLSVAQIYLYSLQ